MGRFFTSERFGRPQVLAACLLLAFLAQCLWLVEKGVRHQAVTPAEIYRLDRGTALWNSLGSGPRADARRAPELGEEDSTNETDPALRLAFGGGDYDAHHSPLWYLIATPRCGCGRSRSAGNIARCTVGGPHLGFGLLLGACCGTWRGAFGNAGGYVAWPFSFSPEFRSCALWFAEPEAGAAWGAFGAIFTAIAVAHTLYAPREVVLWNWRRIMLLGLSLALAAGSQFSLIVVVPVALAFMLYLAPTRRLAALAIWAVACGMAVVLVYASYFFRARAFWQGILHASLLGISWKAYTMPQAYQQVLKALDKAVLRWCWPCRSRWWPTSAGLVHATSATRRLFWSRHRPWGSPWVRRTIPASVFNSSVSPSCSCSWPASPPICSRLAVVKLSWRPSGACWRRMRPGAYGNWLAWREGGHSHSLILSIT